MMRELPDVAIRLPSRPPSAGDDANRAPCGDEGYLARVWSLPVA